MRDMLNLLTLAYIGAACTTFVVVYHVLARWWESGMGRNMMVLVGGLAAVCDLVFLYIAVGHPGWMVYVFSGLYFVIGTTVWWRLGILVREQRAPRKPERRE